MHTPLLAVKFFPSWSSLVVPSYTMKQKIVVKVSMHDDKSRTKALRIAVSLSGVELAALTGQRKDQVEVVGEGIDPVELTRLLRKKIAHAELVSVGEAKKLEQTKFEAVNPQSLPMAGWYPPPPPPHYNCHSHCQNSGVIGPSHDPLCIIM